MKTEEGEATDLAEDGRQRGWHHHHHRHHHHLHVHIQRGASESKIFMPNRGGPNFGPKSTNIFVMDQKNHFFVVSLLLHHCRDRVRRLQRLLLLPRPLPLRRRTHAHDSLLQVHQLFRTHSFAQVCLFSPSSKLFTERNYNIYSWNLSSYKMFVAAVQSA